jgi:hypothetical protein
LWIGAKTSCLVKRSDDVHDTAWILYMGKKIRVKTQKYIDFGEIWVSPQVSCFCTFKVLWKKPFSIVVMWPRLKWMRKEIGECGQKLLSKEKSHYNFGNNMLLNSMWQKLRWTRTTVIWFCEKHISQFCVTKVEVREDNSHVNLWKAQFSILCDKSSGEWRQ